MIKINQLGIIKKIQKTIKNTHLNNERKLNKWNSRMIPAEILGEYIISNNIKPHQLNAIDSAFNVQTNHFKA